MKHVIFAALGIFALISSPAANANSSDSDDDSSYTGCPLGDHDEKETPKTS